jgi:hypothetical protein
MRKTAGKIGWLCLLLAWHGFAREPAPTGHLSAADERIIAALPKVLPGLNQAYGLEVKRSQAVLATYTFKVNAPNLVPDEWIVFVAKPVDLPSQKIGAASGKPKCEPVTDLSPLRQPLLRARIPADDAAEEREMTLVVKTRAELFSRRLVARHALPGPPKPAILSEQDRKLFLRRSRDFDYDGKGFQDWLTSTGLKRPQSEGEVAFAKRVFQHLARTCHYEYLGRQDRSASYVCASAKSDCGGMSVLFAAVMRSQGVPARTLVGRWAKSAKPDDRVGEIGYFMEHVKAEFFATSVGWVPVDVSAAVLHDKSAAKLEYFGTDRGDFLTLHFDSELAVDTLHFGVRPINLLQGGSFWVTGTGTLDDAVVRENWEVEALPGRGSR